MTSADDNKPADEYELQGERQTKVNRHAAVSLSITQTSFNLNHLFCLLCVHSVYHFVVCFVFDMNVDDGRRDDKWCSPLEIHSRITSRNNNNSKQEIATGNEI